ncbi:MAG TPA: TlpA disulfide reductase family protein [Terriglobales bacterium]|jgi:peroxiredoxin|nr:TlpA disulfide reductase family protein [Terriglobales bacterium]
MVFNSQSLRTLWVAILIAFGLSVPNAVAQIANGKLHPPKDRKVAPDIGLEDSEGKRASLDEYRGKVVLLDFWATWCHGCKEEIPWFTEFQRKYGNEGLNVIGVSLDEDGWKVVKPFIKATSVPYRIVLGNASTAKAYAIGQMPDTFLIDRHGRVAAIYVGMVDRNSLEINIRELLAQK